MAIRCSEVIRLMEDYAPKRLSEKWDNTGLLLGDSAKEVNKILVALDITESIIKEAIEENIDLIITHHPIIFKPISSICADEILGKYIISLIKNNISVYCAHTNLDLTEGGVNDSLAKKLGLMDVKNLEVVNSEPYSKIVVFVPSSHLNEVREAMARAGAGFIGDYSDCSFITKGTGTFKPLEGSNPYIGSINKLEEVEELKIEVIVPKHLLSNVIKKMLEAHPYEEVAYDVFALENVKKEYGFAKAGVLDKQLSFSEFIDRVKKVLSVDKVKVVGENRKDVYRVAVSSGSYSSIAKAAYKQGIDVIVTGDLKYHDAREIEELGISAVDAGHFSTENIIVTIIKEYLKDRLGAKVEIANSKESKDVFRVI